MSFEILKDVLYSGQWGTIGPHSLSDGAALADYFGAKYALLTYSGTAAYESVLRSLGVAHGDRIITASYSSPMNSLVAAVCGAAPLFIDIDIDTGMQTPDGIEKALGENNAIKAVVADLPGGNCFDICGIARVCAQYHVPLIVNAGSSLKTSFDGKPLTAYAYAVVCDLEPYIGRGGVVFTDNYDAYIGASAYHNCGRPIGAGSTLNFDDIIGGNMRITEWSACLIAPALDNADAETLRCRNAAVAAILKYTSDFLVPVYGCAGSVSSCEAVIFRYDSEKNNGVSAAEYVKKSNVFYSGYAAMHRQPVFRSDYFRRMTGFDGTYSDDTFENSISAEQCYLWLKI